jgi:hypothetical protein
MERIQEFPAAEQTFVIEASMLPRRLQERGATALYHFSPEKGWYTELDCRVLGDCPV